MFFDPISVFMIPRLLLSHLTRRRAIHTTISTVRPSWPRCPVILGSQLTKRFNSQISQRPRPLKERLPAASPVRNNDELAQWEKMYFSSLPPSHFRSDQSLHSNPRLTMTGKRWDEDTEALTNLCHKQV